jgi:hypothetical protein
MARHVKNWESLPELSPAMSDAVKGVLELVRPKKDATDQCQRDVIDAIRMIENLPPFLSPGVVKKQLSKVVTELKAARTAISKLPLGWRRPLLVDDFLSKLAHVIQKSDDMANYISVTKRSGGSQRTRTVAFKKQIAAEQAFDLLNDWGRRRPTLTKGGDYHQLTGMLIEVAIGRNFVGDVERACARVIHNLRKEGFPGAMERRRQPRQGKLVLKKARK